MKSHRKQNISLLVSRILIGLVVFSNLQCAIYFLIFPANFAPAYELAGIPGQAAIRGYAILFCMWNIPYIFAIIHPVTYRISLLESNLMQFTGLIGESWLITQIPLQYAILRNSIFRFIFFDGAGLVCLLIALFLTRGLVKPQGLNQ